MRYLDQPLVLLLLVGAAAYYLLSNLDAVVKAEIEKYGSAATGVSVHLDKVKISLSSGEGAVFGLVTANPKGFSSPNAMVVGNISVKIDIASLTGNGPIVVKEIIVDKPEITFEVTNNSDNLHVIQNNAESYANSSNATPKNNEKKDGNDSGKLRKIIIDSLSIRGGRITIKHALLQGQELSTSLPDIRLTNIGRKEGGVMPEKVAEQIIDNITVNAAKSATLSLKQALGSLGGVINNLGNNAGNTFGKSLNNLLGH